MMNDEYLQLQQELNRVSLAITTPEQCADSLYKQALALEKALNKCSEELERRQTGREEEWQQYLHRVHDIMPGHYDPTPRK